MDEDGEMEVKEVKEEMERVTEASEVRMMRGAEEAAGESE